MTSPYADEDLSELIALAARYPHPTGPVLTPEALLDTTNEAEDAPAVIDLRRVHIPAQQDGDLCREIGLTDFSYAVLGGYEIAED